MTEVEAGPQSPGIKKKPELSTKAAMALIAKKKREMAKNTFTQKLARMGIVSSNSLDFKK